MSARRRRKRSRVVPTPGRTLLVLPSIPDELDDATKDGLAIRNAASTSGICPSCGARGEVRADRERAGIHHLTFLHETGCNVLADGEAA